MSKKQLPDLDAATQFDDGDLLLVHKSDEGVDNKITYTNLLTSIGNTGVNGFIVSSDDDNLLNLDTSNGVSIDKYYNGMKASFISTIDTDGNVQIRIGSLPYKYLYQYGTDDITSVLQVGDYVEAIFIGTSATGNWYQTNLPTGMVYSNDYRAVGEVSEDESSTTYSLTSAIGLKKTAYYNAMSCLFTTDIASKGSILLNVDDLGLKPLKDPIGDNIPFMLNADQAIMAVYNGTNFIKRLFSSVDQPAPPYIPDEPIPEINKVTINVGPTRNIKAINDAITQLIKDFGITGGNRVCTIELDNDFVWSKVLYLNQNLPWITINASNIINIDLTPDTYGAYAIYLYNTGYINISGKYNYMLKGNNLNYYLIYSYGDGTINFNITLTYSLISNSNSGLSMLTTSGSGANDYGTINISNSNITLRTWICNPTSIRSASFNWYDSTLTFSSNIPVTVNGNMMHNAKNLTANNLTIQDSRTYSVSVAALYLFSSDQTNDTFNITNCNFVIPSTSKLRACKVSEGKAVLTNNTFTLNSTTQNAPNIYALSGAQIILDGGNYSNTINTIPSITSDGVGSIIKLRNGVVTGLTSTSNEGQIINE